jgi:hypothetical protein
VTSYGKGLNGVMIDVLGLPAAATLTADDFAFRSGTSAAPGDWRTGPRPAAITVRRGAGVNGSDRITLVWADPGSATDPATAAVANGWLEVTVKDSSDTGLQAPDVFYFGNLIGETGDISPTSELVVNALDLAAVKRNLTTATVLVTSQYDFNKDGRINALDVAAVKRTLTRRLPLSPIAPAMQPGQTTITPSAAAICALPPLLLPTRLWDKAISDVLT